MALNENDNSIKGAYEDFDLAFMDEIFSDYFSENKGFFKIHDKKQQKIPVINIYKVNYPLLIEAEACKKSDKLG